MGYSLNYTLKRRIYLILKSPRLGFWRVCGKDKQLMYFKLLKDTKDTLGKSDLLSDVVTDYEASIKNMSSVGDKERKVKLHTLHAYAKKEMTK